MKITKFMVFQVGWEPCLSIAYYVRKLDNLSVLIIEIDIYLNFIIV